MEVKRRRGPRPERDPEKERARIEGRTTEQWIDEGSVRGAARAAAQRGATPSRPPREVADPVGLDPTVVGALTDAVGTQRGERLAERLAQASEALDRERFDEAKRIANGVVKEVAGLAAGHEIVGLANYRLGRYKQAASSLAKANDLHPNPALLPPLADSYRALRRWAAVDRVWAEIRSASPAHAVMSEGRIVAAGARADQGDLPGALELMLDGEKPVKKVRDHHLRQWYMIGDLYDRMSDPINARRWFSAVAQHAPDFVDVQTRLRHVGR